MAVLELPSRPGEMDVPATPEAASGGAVEPPAVATDADEFDDAEFAALFRQGVKWGIPVMYVIIALICLIAVPGYYPLLVAALLPALAGGWYFGGVFAMLMVHKEQD